MASPWRRIRNHRQWRAAGGQGVFEARVGGVECDPTAAVARVVRLRGHMSQDVVELGLRCGEHHRGAVHRGRGEQHGRLDADRLATAQMGVLVVGEPTWIRGPGRSAAPRRRSQAVSAQPEMTPRSLHVAHLDSTVSLASERRTLTYPVHRVPAVRPPAVDRRPVPGAVGAHRRRLDELAPVRCAPPGRAADRQAGVVKEVTEVGDPRAGHGVPRCQSRTTLISPVSASVWSL